MLEQSWQSACWLLQLPHRYVQGHSCPAWSGHAAAAKLRCDRSLLHANPSNPQLGKVHPCKPVPLCTLYIFFEGVQHWASITQGKAVTARLSYGLLAGGGPHQLSVLLEAESLLNDATSITLFLVFLKEVQDLQSQNNPPKVGGREFGSIVASIIWLTVGQLQLPACLAKTCQQMHDSFLSKPSNHHQCCKHWRESCSCSACQARGSVTSGRCKEQVRQDAP